MKILFPLPLVYDGNESRFLQRDGARFASEFNSRGHIGIKLIIDGGQGFQKPESPLLDTATWEDWISSDYWGKTKADLVLLYGGCSRKLLPVAHAIKQANIPLFLKMDSAMGLLPYWHTDFYRLFRTSYHSHHQHHSRVIAGLKALISRLVEVSGLRTHWLPAYFSLFDVITVESDYALANMKLWFNNHHLPHLAKRVKLLPHPIPDSFIYNPAIDSKTKTIIAVAQNWKNPLKGASLLAGTLREVLKRRTDYHAVIVGAGSDIIKQHITAQNNNLCSRISAIERIAAEKTKDFYCKAQILLITSGSEGWPLVVSEATCCGCSVVFPPELKPLKAFVKCCCGQMAAWRSPRRMAEAVLNECAQWDANIRCPQTISKYWTPLMHTDTEVDRLLEWLQNVK